MRKLFLFIAAALVSTGMWAVDVVPSFIDGYTTTYDVSTSVTGFGNVYFASRSGITKNTPTDHTNYRTPKGNYVFELTQPSTIDITLYNTSSGRTVMIGLYTMDATVFSVWQNAANQNKNMLTWLIDNKTSYAADGETTLETYFSDKLKQSSGTIASGSDNEKALMPEATTSADGMNDYAKKLYTKYWRHESAASLNRNEPTIVSLNGGEPVPAGKYIMTIGDSGSNMGIETITITPASQTVKYYNNGGSGSITDGTGTSITLSDGTGFTAPSEYTFAGWNTAADGSGTAYAAGQTVTVSLNLYAQWTQAITLDANLTNHGTGDNGSATALYNGTELSNIVHTTPEEGYTLNGYYTAATEGVKILNANGSFAADAITGYVVEGAWKKTGATTLYAQYAEPEKYSVAHVMTNVTSTGAYGADAATQGTDYVAVFTAKAEYSLPATITVTIGGVAQTEGEGYTYSAGTVTIPGAYVTGNIVITVEGVHNECATPTITASTTFNFTNKGYAVTITNNEEGSTLKYSTDGTNWSDYTATLYATTTTTFYAKSVKDNYADSENATLEVTNSYDAEKKYVAWLYESNYQNAPKNYNVANDNIYKALKAIYNVVLVDFVSASPSADLKKADLVVLSEAVTGGSAKTIAMKDYVGEVPMLNMKMYAYTYSSTESKNRWGWGAPANEANNKRAITPVSKSYKVLDGVTFAGDSIVLFGGTTDQHHIQTVSGWQAEPTGNVAMAKVGNNTAMHASTSLKFFALGLSCDDFGNYTDNAVTIVKNAAAMLIAGEALDALLYNVTISDAIQNGEVTADKAKAIEGETVTLTVTPDAEYVATNVSYNGTTITPVENVYSFIMPAANVTVTATFAKSASGVDNTEVGAKAVKTLKNGVLIIEKNGVHYNMLGERVQ